MRFQITPTLPDLDNSQTFYARLYEAVSAWDKDQYSADEARIPQKYQTVRQELALPLADISLTTANMDMKLIQMDRETCGLSDDTKIARFR